MNSFEEKNVLKDYGVMKEVIKNPKTVVNSHNGYVWYIQTCQWKKIKKLIT